MKSDRPERRKVRSDDPDIAVAIQLAHVANVLDLEAIVLADDFGRRLAHVGDHELSDLLASSAMWAEFNDGAVDDYTFDVLQERDPELEPSHIVSEPLRIPGDDAHLRIIALGRSLVSAIGVHHAARGIERIHAAS